MITHNNKNYYVVYDRDEQIVPYLLDRYPYLREQLHTIIDKMPKVIFRRHWNIYAKQLGLPYTARTLANHDCLGIGPKCYKNGKINLTYKPKK